MESGEDGKVAVKRKSGRGVEDLLRARVKGRSRGTARARVKTR